VSHTTVADRASLDSIDVVRGAIMVLMALNHVRDFFGVQGTSPTDVSPGHNLPDAAGSSNAIWMVLHGPGFVVRNGPHIVFASYPLAPWIGVTAAGFGLGRVYDWAPERRRAFLLRAGAALPAAFVLLRAVNIYGDLSRWSTQRTTTATVLSLLNTTKYPPSLLFLLMMLGPALLCLRAVDHQAPRRLRAATVMGRVPLFYFLIHLPLIHLIAVAVSVARYHGAHWMFESPDLAHYPFTTPPGWGFSLPVVYALWIAVVVAVYPLCRWFASLKQRRRDAWLSYL
jgi:uncharacterized membrane protein